MDIKLPVPIRDAKAMLISTSSKIHCKNYFTNGLLFEDQILKLLDFYST